MNLYKGDLPIFCGYFNNIGLNLSVIWKSVDFDILKFSTHQLSS